MNIETLPVIFHHIETVTISLILSFDSVINIILLDEISHIIGYLQTYIYRFPPV